MQRLQKESSGQIKKGRGGIRPGQLPVMVSYPVEARLGQKAYTVTRRNWVYPEKALKDKSSTIDWEYAQKVGFSVPTPDSLDRFHIHDGIKEPHKITDKHEDSKAEQASKKELEKYFNLFYREEDPDLLKRLHSHEGAEDLHSASEFHKDPTIQREHKDELLDFENEYRGRKAEPSWLDKLNVSQEEVKIKISDFRTKARKYWARGFNPAYLFDDRRGNVYVYSKESKLKKFSGKRPDVEALSFTQDLFERAALKKSIDGFLAKQNLDKVDITIAPPATATKEILFNKYKSGDSEVVLAGIGGKFYVSMNGTTVKETDSLTDAIARYYRAIADIIEAGSEDRDIGLEIFGERVMSINRAVRPMIEKLGDMDTAKCLEEFQYDLLKLDMTEDLIKQFFFNPSLMEPAKSAQVQMLTPQPEMGQEKDAVNSPSRGDLKKKDYEAQPKKRLEQQPIQSVSDLKHKNSISPAVVMH